MYASVNVVANGLASRIRAPHSLKSSNGFATIAASPIRSAWISAGTGSSGRRAMSAYIASAERW